MNTYAKRLLLALVALSAVSTAPLLRAELTPPKSTFFSPQYYLGDDLDGYPVYYLSYFNTYTYDESSSAYVYKYNFGWLYYFGGSGTNDTDDAYFYDFNSDDFLYTSAELYPYFYSFNKENFLYYFEDTNPREFYDFGTDSYIFY